MINEMPLPKKITDNLLNILNILAGIFEVPVVLINRINEDDIEIVQRSNTLGNFYVKGKKRVNDNRCFCVHVVESRNELYIDNCLLYPEWKHCSDTHFGMYSYYGIPLYFNDGTIFGILCLLDKFPIKNSKRHGEILNISKSIIEGSINYICEVYRDNKNEIDYLISRKRSDDITEGEFEKQYKMFFEKDFSNNDYSTEIFDLLLPLTGEDENHGIRLSKLGREFAKYLKLEKKDAEILILSLKYHDIGNILVKEEVLKKQGYLSEKELDEVKKHTETGFKILNNAKGFQKIALNVLYHHENWDGSGYPTGLFGNEIPYFSRIIRLIDRFDALTCEGFGNIGKASFTKENAIKEITALSGSVFDGRLSKEFIEMINNCPKSYNVYRDEIESLVH